MVGGLAPMSSGRKTGSLGVVRGDSSKLNEEEEDEASELL